VTKFFPEPVVHGSEDHIFRELLVTVWNRILLRLQDARLSSKELEEVGFMLRRVWVVAEAYKAKKAEYTLADWLQKLVGVAKEAGVPVPGV
jgi:hypothetical protein